MCGVAPLAQRLEQRPFKSWVQGSNPWGGTVFCVASTENDSHALPSAKIKSHEAFACCMIVRFHRANHHRNVDVPCTNTGEDSALPHTDYRPYLITLVH